MAKIVIQNEEGQNLNRYKLTPVDGQPNTYDLERVANITKQGTPYNNDTMGHYVQNEDLTAHTNDKNNPHGVTKTQIGLDKVDNTPDSGKSVNYANSSGHSDTSGTSNYTHYSSHAVGSGGTALRNITMSTAGPSGGQDGDVWHQYK